MAASDPLYRPSHGVSAVLHTSGSASNVNTSTTTSAKNYTEGKLYCIAVLAADGDVEDPTITGGNITWTEEVDQTFDTTHRLTVFAGVCTSDATNASLTIEFGAGNAQDEVAWIVLLLDGAVSIVQADSASGEGDTPSSTGLSAFSHIRNATLAFTAIKGHATVSPPEFVQFSKLDEVQSGSGFGFEITLQAQWRSSNRTIVQTELESTEKWAIGALEIEAIPLTGPLLWYSINPQSGSNRNAEPGTLLQAQLARKRAVMDYAHLIYENTIDIVNEWDDDPPFGLLRSYLTSSPFPTTYQGIVWLDEEKWGKVVDPPPGWDDDDEEAYRVMYQVARDAQPSAAIACLGIPQTPPGTGRDFIKDHVDIGSPFLYVHDDLDRTALDAMVDRVAKCVDDLGIRCVPYVAGHYTSGHPVTAKQWEWMGGENFQRVLTVLRDETDAEGVVMWTLEDDTTDRDLAKWARYLQRMQLFTTIPHPFEIGATPGG